MGNTVPVLFESIAYSVRGVFLIETTLLAWQSKMWGLYFSQGLGKPHECVCSYGQWHQALTGLWVPVKMYLFQPLDRWLHSQRGTEEPFHSQLWLPALAFSLPSHYIHCPQAPLFIDLGPVPVSNCFLWIGFIADCWLLSTSFSLPHYALSYFPMLISEKPQKE